MKSRPRKKPLLARLLGGLAYALLLAIALAAGSFFGWIKSSPLGAALMSEIVHPKAPEEAFSGRNSLTVLLLGCDEDLSYGGKRVLKGRARADMMLLAKMDFAHGRVTGVSIPRDTQVSLPGYRTHKINAYHALAPAGEGGDVTKQAVEKLLPGVTVDRVVTLDYDAFQRMVDLVGGVRIRVDKKMDYDDNAGHLHIHFAPGLRKMDGGQAMGYVRFRHADDDFHRQERQKQFLVAFKEALMRRPAVLPQVLNEAMCAMGNAFTPDELASLTFFARGIDEKSIQMGQIPVRQGRGTNLRVDEDRLDEVLRQYSMIDGNPGATTRVSER